MAPRITPGSGGRYHAEFRLSITRALGDQLADALSGLDRAPLSEANLSGLQNRAGVYQLFIHREPEDEFVYVGKAETSLPKRLRQHRGKLSGRENVSLGEILFSCLYVDEDFSALAPEQLLIGRYRSEGKIPWNTNGFGNKDPGRKRDDTAVKLNHFDARYPADLSREVEGIPFGTTAPVGELCRQVKRGLPYNFRYGKLAAFADLPVAVPCGRTSADEVFTLISRCLPDPWQVVALPGYAIMYPDSPREYLSGRRYYRGGRVTTATPHYEFPGDIEEEASSDDDEDE